MEIKDQLLLLQNHLLENDPEKIRSLEKENAKLKRQLEDNSSSFLAVMHMSLVCLSKWDIN